MPTGVVLVTHLLASTDEPRVHAEHAKYRRDLLKAGVRLYDVGATIGRGKGMGFAVEHRIDRLQAKVAAIDHHIVYIGSMGLDPRSAIVNTGKGLVIERPQIAQTPATIANPASVHCRDLVGTTRIELTNGRCCVGIARPAAFGSPAT